MGRRTCSSWMGMRRELGRSTAGRVRICSRWVRRTDAELKTGRGEGDTGHLFARSGGQCSLQRDGTGRVMHAWLQRGHYGTAQSNGHPASVSGEVSPLHNRANVSTVRVLQDMAELWVCWVEVRGRRTRWRLSAGGVELQSAYERSALTLAKSQSPPWRAAARAPQVSL
jgi:hypothetical protein